MKKTIFLAILSVIAAILCLAGCDNSTEGSEHAYYPLTTIVREVNYDNDVVVVEDANDNLWIFYGTEDWMVGDISSMIMDDMGTEDVYDDEIITCCYNGTIQKY